MGIAKVVAKKIISIADVLINITTIIIILLLLTYGSYAIWDSNRLLDDALPKRYADYKPLKGEGIEVFRSLQKKNPEVFGWLNVYGTNIDYPLVQASDDWKYINTDVKGNYSLTGSLFLSSENKKDFSDFNSIVYGHNMTPKVMFGGIKDFKEKSYFKKHMYGDIYFSGKHHGLIIISLLEANAYDGYLYSICMDREMEINSYLKYLAGKAVHTRNIQIKATDRIVLLSTCSNTSTNGRDILLGLITDEVYEDSFIGTGNGNKNIIEMPFRIWKFFSLCSKILIIVLFLLMFSAVVGFFIRKRMKKK